MKKIYILNICLFLFCAVMPLSQLTAQARYKHVPRVKVEKINQTKQENITKPVATTLEQPVITETPTVAETPANIVETQVADNSPAVNVMAKDKKGPVVKNKTIKENKPAKSVDFYTEKLKKNSKLFQVEEVNKTKLIGFILWFVIIIILAALLLILAFVLLGAISYSLWYIFLVVGGVALIIAFILLILGLI